MSASLESLPHELILMVFEFLIPYDTNSFRGKDLNCELWCEFYKTLTSVCLVSKGMAELAKPTLYREIHFCPGVFRNSLMHHLRLIRTLTEKPLLARYITCIHNDTCTDEIESYSQDHKLMYKAGVAANALWGVELSCDRWWALFRTIPRDALLLFLANLAVNIERLYITVIPETLLEFRALFLLRMHRNRPMPSQEPLQVGCCNLQILRIKTDDTSRPDISLREYSRFLRFLRLCPKLEHFAHFGLKPEAYSPLKALPIANFASLRVLHLQDMEISVETAASILKSCVKIQTFSYWPGDVYGGEFCLSPLYPALYAHSATLEHIEISSGVGPEFEGNYVGDPIGSLKHFDKLKILRIPNIALTGIPLDYEFDPNGMETTWWYSDFRPRKRIVEMLPYSLEILHLSFEQDNIGDFSLVLWDFLKDVHQLPNLRTFDTSDFVNGTPEEHPELTEGFLKAGITSRKTMAESDRMRLLLSP